MKNIKYIVILLFQVSLLQFTFGQSTQNDGRSVGVAPGTTLETQSPPTPRDVPNRDGFVVDLDVANEVANKENASKEDTYYPIDMEIAREEIMASTNPVEVAKKINELNDMVADLLRTTEELRLENKVIRESLNNCCSNANLGLSAKHAYLLQNAPNPFAQSADIRYFVPEGLQNVEIQISNFKGEVMSAIKVKETGYGKVVVDSSTLTNGTFVYTLFVNDVIIDSKVMIKTK